MTTKTKNIISWVIAGLLTALFLFSATGKLMGQEEVVKMFTASKLEHARVYIGIVELVGALLLLIPRTNLYGTLILTAYLGAAVTAHVQMPEFPLMPILIMAFVWLLAHLRGSIKLV